MSAVQKTRPAVDTREFEEVAKTAICEFGAEVAA